MKIRKRILSLALALMLLIATAVPVSAAVTRYEGIANYDGCSFGTFAILNTHTLQNIIELNSIPSNKDYNDYILETYAMFHVYDSEGLIIRGGYRFSNPSTRISSLTWTEICRYYSSWNTFLVNNEVVDRVDLCVV